MHYLIIKLKMQFTINQSFDIKHNQTFRMMLEKQVGLSLKTLPCIFFRLIGLSCSEWYCIVFQCFVKIRIIIVLNFIFFLLMLLLPFFFYYGIFSLYFI